MCKKCRAAAAAARAEAEGHKHPLYHVWWGMITRCHDEKSAGFVWYGARGITVCDEWRRTSRAAKLGSVEGFRQFLRDMGERPKGMTIDRIDNNLGYFPGNCRWATHAQQANNKRSNKRVVVHGVSHTISEWGQLIGRPGWEQRARKYQLPLEVALARLVAVSGRVDWVKTFGLPHPPRRARRAKATPLPKCADFDADAWLEVRLAFLESSLFANES